MNRNKKNITSKSAVKIILRELGRIINQGIRLANKVLKRVSYTEHRIFWPDRIFLPIPNPTQTVLNADLVRAAGAINICTSDNPCVTVIIVINGNCGHLIRCLASIARASSSIEMEVIVVDDCPNELFAAALESIAGITFIQNKTRQGNISSFNIGAMRATGRFLCFLDEDTEVATMWLDEMVRTFYEFPKTGLVGSKLVCQNGKIRYSNWQGWRKRGAIDLAYGGDQSAPVYNFAREVEYCPDVSMMVPKTLFDELGGFNDDEQFVHCSRQVLAFKIRAMGYRVIYQPLSVVLQYTGLASEQEADRGTNAFSVLIENFSVREEVQQECKQSSCDVGGKNHLAKIRHVLVLEHTVPSPNQDAGSVTVFNMLLLLREMGFQVTFIPEKDYLYRSNYSSDLQRVGINVQYAPYIKSVSRHLKEHADKYDLVFLFRPIVAKRHLRSIRQYCPKAKVIYYGHDLHFLRMTRESELINCDKARKSADEMRKMEIEIFQDVDVGIVVSDFELEIIKDELPRANLFAFPLILHQRGRSRRFSERQGIMFVGGYQHAPNVDAVKYFVADILPLILERLGDVKFYIVGSNPTNEVLSLANDNVVVTGFADNLTPLLESVRVSVAPLRYGAGIKGKVGTALSAGLPVVATTIAVEGMDLQDGKNVLVADDPETFSAAVCMAYQNETIWNELSEQGLIAAQINCGVDNAWQVLAEVLASVGFDCERIARELPVYREDKWWLDADVTAKGSS